MVVVCVLLVAVVIGAVYYYPKQTGKNNASQSILLHKVEKSDFEAFITEPGEVASSSNVVRHARNVVVKGPDLDLTQGNDTIKVMQ